MTSCSKTDFKRHSRTITIVRPPLPQPEQKLIVPLTRLQRRQWRHKSCTAAKDNYTITEHGSGELISSSIPCATAGVGTRYIALQGLSKVIVSLPNLLHVCFWLVGWLEKPNNKTPGPGNIKLIIYISPMYKKETNNAPVVIVELVLCLQLHEPLPR